MAAWRVVYLPHADNVVVSLDSVDEYAQHAHARYTLLMHSELPVSLRDM